MLTIILSIYCPFSPPISLKMLEEQKRNAYGNGGKKKDMDDDIGRQCLDGWMGGWVGRWISGWMDTQKGNFTLG